MKKSEADMEQSERFKQAARELECDDDPARFVQIVRKVAKAAPAPQEKAARPSGTTRSKKPLSTSGG